MTKFQVTHWENKKELSGYRVPRITTDGEFDSETEALDLASRLRFERHLPHFVVPIAVALAGFKLPEVSASGATA